MFKKILLILLLVIPAGVAMADDYPYFAFQTSNGETKTLSVTGLKITFSNGNIVATNEEGANFTASIESLAKMYFSSTATGIDAIAESVAVEGEIYNVQGVRVGRTDEMGEVRGLPEGVYVVKREGKTHKVLVK